ncbi:MAG: amidohydrolase family protein [Cyanobacteria bacterium NC_groundwater_1444_Ag_S-0.65um_54_12]|nr:amidohydrolase family protein [Cyanobacteria bacterium NC_groundwater_1444_Ag_S-0.65um_54_12]
MKRIDIHTHLAGNGQDGSGCQLSPRMTRSLGYQLLRHAPGPADFASDRRFAERLLQYAQTAQEVDYVCVLALDGVYDNQGKLLPDKSHMVVPNAYVVEVCKRSSRLLPVISINPQRQDAISELERWGPEAVALKWLPPLQHFNPAASQYADFRLRLKELALPVICHSGTEHTFPGARQKLGDPRLCEPLLQLGIPVIFAHCGTCTFFQPGADFVPAFLQLLDKYDHAFGDTAGFCTPVRAGQLRRLAIERYVGRILHGSDYPVPISAIWFWHKLGPRRVHRLECQTNPLDKDALIKQALGLPEATFTAAFSLLEPRIRSIKIMDTRGSSCNFQEQELG